MMTRNRWITILAACGLAGLLLGAGVWRHYKFKRAVAAYRQELASRGVVLSIDDLVPQSTRESRDGGARIVQAAIAVTGTSDHYRGAMLGVTPGRSAVSWQQPELLDENLTNLWPKLGESLKRQAPQLKAVCAALEIPKFHVALDYSRGHEMRLPHLTRLKGLSQTLGSAMVWQLHEGNATEAFRYLRAGTRLMHCYDVEPLMISRLVLNATAAVTWGATWEALQYTNWTEAHLAELQGLWAETDLVSGADQVFALERAFTETVFAQLRRSHAMWLDWRTAWGMGGNSVYQNVMGDLMEEPVATVHQLAREYVGYWPWRWWDSYRDELVCMKVWQEAIAAHNEFARLGAYMPVHPTLTNALRRLKHEHLGNGPSMAEFFASDSIMQKFLLRLATAQTQREMMIAGLALHRYRLSEGKWPARLDELAPRFVSAVPRDFMDGKPLRYRVNDDGTFLLYSLGSDFRDDGGDAAPPKGTANVWQGKDWVWPRPASVDEVRAHWKRLAKKQSLKAEAETPTAAATP